MEDLDKIIENYLKAKDTDYAIMINGDWGCGKSYYIKNDFQKTVALFSELRYTVKEFRI